MAEERQYIPISQLSDAKSVDQNTDVLIISQKQNSVDQEYVSKKITAVDFMFGVDMRPAEKTKIGGFKIYDKIEDQEGEQKFVDLNEHNQAFVKVPKADNNTIIEANGKIFVSQALKDLAEDADNIVKKNVTNVSVEVKDGQYIAGFEQKNGKIQNVQYGDLSGERNRHYTFTPLIDWDKRDTNLTSADGVSIQWCYTGNSESYKSVYADGRYAQYVIPLKQEFTDFKKLLIIPVEYSDGSPDIESRIIDTQILDWMLACGFVQDNKEPKIYSIVQPHIVNNYEQLFIPYNGSEHYPTQKSNPDAHSTKNRLLTLVISAYARPVLEIFGIN